MFVPPIAARRGDGRSAGYRRRRQAGGFLPAAGSLPKALRASPQGSVPRLRNLPHELGRGPAALGQRGQVIQHRFGRIREMLRGHRGSRRVQITAGVFNAI